MDLDIVTMLCQAAVDAFESETNMRLVQAVYKQDFACFYDPILLEAFPVTQIGQVRYRDTSGDWQTLASADYISHLQKGHPEVRVISSKPSLSSDHDYPVSVEFTAGYEDTADIPVDIRLALAQFVVSNYENRHVQVRKLPDSWSFTVNRHRKTRF